MISRRIFASAVASGLLLGQPSFSPRQSAFAQQTASDVTPARPYSDDVVAKAEKILFDAGLKRSGKSVLASGTAEMNRVMTSLAKSRKGLKLLADARKLTEEQMLRVRQEFQLRDAQNGELNLQLARGPLTAAANNQLVGSINANNTRLRQLDEQRRQLREKLAEDRKALNEAEAKYAEMVLALRRDFTALQTQLEAALQDEKLQIALKVAHANFQTPESVDIATLLGATDRRVKQIEKEIFSESIPIDVSPAGALYVQVSVGDASTPMVLDSGASLVSLPAETATKLGVTIPPEAPRLQLVLADGRVIEARRVVVPTMRVGQFEAQNVEAAVLDPTAIRAEPLLGMSFLENFRFEIDTSSRSLKMLRVGEE